MNHNGGEIRMELFQTPTGKLQVTLYAFFISGQTPEKIPYVTYGAEQNGVFGPCSATSTYVNSTNPGKDVNDSRVYVDVGDTITLSGGGVDIVMNRYNNIADKRGLIMKIGYTYHGAAIGTVPVDMVLPGAEYTIKMSGIPGVFPYKLKLPTNWNAWTGNVAFQGTAANSFQATGGIHWGYLYNQEQLVNGGLLQFSGTNAMGVKESWFCAGDIAGRIDVPGETTAMLPPSGQLQAATFSHQKVKWNSAATGGVDRLIDVIGVNCRQTTYTVQP